MTVNRGGRPASEDPRCKTISARFSGAEYALIESKIRESNLSKSEAVRVLLLSEKLPQKIFGGLSKEAAGIYQKLQPLQSNLNQLARAINAGIVREISREEMIKIGAVIARVEAHVKALRHEILTVSGGTNDYKSGRWDERKGDGGQQESRSQASRPAPLAISKSS